jgi:hypothetical protein
MLKKLDRCMVKQDKRRLCKIFEDHVMFFAGVNFFAKIVLIGEESRRESNLESKLPFSGFYL